MPHLVKIPLPAPESGLWATYAARDLDVVLHYLCQADRKHGGRAGYTAAVLRALICYSKPFTERANSLINQHPGERDCFLSLAADLGADLRLHAILLQARDAVLALSDFVPVPVAQLNTRAYKQSDPRLARIARKLDLGRFRTLAVRMRVACHFREAEPDSRRL